ncbi:hypothetical protein LPB140_02465 [Sphingorhabdus lutea]|uniref:DUF1176 domain-containing protein n=1 Tax=Sphingorhabdus lutea TaxID=1913578 RepID=A0A1L3J9R9_9SPHN|nr:DUF1176 domain-containing protein [Sphingorhabdus lutea]APG61876.1 hypothetical protein LPB140_02465 [Sphingorhabdus lutea]
MFGTNFNPIAAFAIEKPTITSKNQMVKLLEVKNFTDWVVGCDNMLQCRTVIFRDYNDIWNDEFPELIISRTAGRDEKGNASIILQGLSDKESVEFIIDGKSYNYKSNNDGANTANGDFVIKNSNASTLIAQMLKGNILKLKGKGGKDLGSLSLNGMSASLRYMDALQKRAGTTSALVAKGRQIYTLSPPSIPIIKAAKIGKEAAMPSKAMVKNFAEKSSCSEDRMMDIEDNVYSLGTYKGKIRALVIIFCGSGAYNISNAIYIAEKQGKNWIYYPAKFNITEYGTEPDGVTILVNSAWDPLTQTLDHYVKFRGLGDCGQSASYVWDGEIFRLSQNSIMPECRGSIDYISNYNAKIEYVLDK